MPARLTIHTPGSPSRTVPLAEGDPFLIGRDPACALSLKDSRVSARHALLVPEGPGWRIVDQASKNGTLLNGLPVLEALLAPGDWISIGGCHAQLEVLSGEQEESERREARDRRQTARDIRERLLWEEHPEAILLRLMESVLSITGAERGFVLTFGAGREIQPLLAVGYPPEMAPGRFGGSGGAVRRVMATGRPVVAANAHEHAFLGKRPSVQELGLKALACVPLTGPARRELLGVLYVDGRKAGGTFTELDLELLEALAEKAALIVEGMRIDRKLQDFLHDPRQAALLEILSRHLASEDA